MSENPLNDESSGEAGGVNAELEAKVEELARANIALYEAARAKSEFVANMSHELRTPLNSIIGFADVLLGQAKGVAAEEQIRYLQNIRKAGYRLLELLSELLNFARLESGRVQVNTGPVSVPGLLQEVVTNLETLPLNSKRLDFATDVDSRMPTVITDEVKLNQILTNLGSNAVKFTPDGGGITFGAALSGATLAVWVADSGIGLDDKEKALIFQRFRQGDSGPARKFEGVGLGLYIVKALAGLMGGDVKVESRKGNGATFTVTLPVELMDL